MARPSFLPQHITALVVKVPTDDLIVYEDCIDPFPALRSIEYRPNTHITHRCDSKHAVKHIFEQEDFETIRAFRMWKKVRGLKGFSITAEAPPKWQDGVVTGVWEANVKKMEMLLNPLVTQPKPKTVQISSSCCGFSDATALQYQKCTNMSPSEHIRSAILKMKAGSTKEGDYFEEDVLQRPDAVVIDAFTKDPEGFISWARKMKSTKDNIEASKSVAK
ncbi:hypothetical protein HII31_10469 [Pseudocercospora fuligena]|uniref:Uncharacterized protein n=1 Tax=Pseudocercospora fuligena TaxID=685502 RepID=A0A8H6RAR3_9PEZI|nr:hypothetical protein HII31_10469 [Pseudocercospora fuligena]